MDLIDPSPQTASEMIVEAPTHPRQKSLLSSLTLSDWVVIGCLLALFGPMLVEMYQLWTIPEAPQSYGLLVLPAALILAWMLRSRLEGLTPRPSRGGLLLVAVGLGVLLIGTLRVAITLSGIGFALIVPGIIWARYGGAVVRRLWFPLAFLLAMVPIPHEVLNDITFPLQEISVRWAALLLRPFTEVTVLGTQLHLSNYTLNVIAPCSGLTIVLPLLVLASYYLYIVTAPLWKKLILVALTFPVAMVVNAVRVALIGMVGELYGGRAADTFHDYSGLITVILGFVALIFIAQEMKCHHISDEIAF